MFRAHLELCGRVVLLGEYTSSRLAAEARDRAYIRAVGPRSACTYQTSKNANGAGLNYHISKYACDPIELFTMFDSKLRSELWGTRWKGVQDLDFAFWPRRLQKEYYQWGRLRDTISQRKGAGEGIIDGSYSSGDNLDGIREAVFGTLSARDSVRMQHEAPLKLNFPNTGGAPVETCDAMPMTAECSESHSTIHHVDMVETSAILRGRVISRREAASQNNKSRKGAVSSRTMTSTGEIKQASPLQHR